MRPSAPKDSLLLKNQTLVLFLTNGITALAFALVLPVMSLFLVSGLHTEPAYIGLYTTLTALMTVIVSQKMTGLMDKGVPGKRLLLISLTGIVAAALGFSVATEFWHAMLVGCLLMPFASSSIPLILTIIRHYADASGKNSTKLNSQMRSSVSMLWVFGPPLAFLSVDQLGFATNFRTSAMIAVFVIAWVVVALVQPASQPAEADSVTGKSTKPGQLGAEVWMLGAVMMLANMANSAYINTMPLYLTKDLGLSTAYPGWLMGAAAAVEIPVMLLVAGWSLRWGKLWIMKAAFVCAMVYYVVIYFTSSLAIIMTMQLMNGLFFGIFAGLGVTLMQDYAGNNIGKASAFYTNAMLVGTMLGSSTMGLVSQYWGFKAPFLLCLSSIVMAFVGMSWFEKRVAGEQSEPQPQ